MKTVYLQKLYCPQKVDNLTSKKKRKKKKAIPRSIIVIWSAVITLI